MKIFYIGFILLITISASSQVKKNYPLISKNPIVLDNYSFDEYEIIDLLRSNPEVKYEDIDIQEVRLEVWDYNFMIDSIQQSLNDRKNLLIDKKQEIVALEHLGQIIDRITAKKESINKIHEDIEANLSNLGYKGIYVFGTKMGSSWLTNKEMREKAIKYITPKAVENTNGSFIESVTTLKKKEGFDDEFYRYIKDVIEGTCNIEAEIFTKLNRKKEYYLIMVKLNTKPLQENLDLSRSTEYGIPENTVVFDAMLNPGKINDLKNLDIPKSEIKQLKNHYKHWEDLIDKENERIREIESNYILTGDKKIKRLYSEIALLEKERDEKIDKLKHLMNNYSDTELDISNVDYSIIKAKSDIDKRISKLENKIIEVESYRLFADYQILVTTSGDYFEQVASEVVKAKEELCDTYSKVGNYKRVAELENDYYSKFIGEENTKTRRFDKIWLFPEPGEGDFFKMSIVVKFKIVD